MSKNIKNENEFLKWLKKNKKVYSKIDNSKLEKKY